MNSLFRSVLSFAVVLVFPLLFPVSSFAWNALGHMVVANIAYQNLTPAAREKVDQLIAHLHTEYADVGTFPALAVWADSLRSQKIETYTHWHYIDYSYSIDGSPTKNVIDTDNAVWALQNIEPVLKYAQANPYERARFLAFLTHIVADLHQPLHTVTGFTTKNVDGDKGGNLYFIRYKGDRINLHKLWDGGVGIFEGDSSMGNVDALTTEITTHYPASYFHAKASDINVDDWTAEGMNVAKENVYSTPEEKEPKNEYLDAGKKIAEQRVALAGYRLATLLNQLLG